MSDPICMWCDEPILPTDERPHDVVTPWHRECLIRGVFGSLAHFEKRCSCYGGCDDGDPPGMTRREAARAATVAFDARRRQGLH